MSSEPCFIWFRQEGLHHLVIIKCVWIRKKKQKKHVMSFFSVSVPEVVRPGLTLLMVGKFSKTADFQKVISSPRLLVDCSYLMQAWNISVLLSFATRLSACLNYSVVWLSIWCVLPTSFLSYFTMEARISCQVMLCYIVLLYYYIMLCYPILGYAMLCWVKIS